VCQWLFQRGVLELGFHDADAPWQSSIRRYDIPSEWSQPSSQFTNTAGFVRWYLDRYGPATLHDFRWWAGKSVTEARAMLDSLGPEITQISVDGFEKPMMMLTSRWEELQRAADTCTPMCRFLPYEDALLKASV